MTAVFALLLFAVIGAGVIAVTAALGSHADRTLAEWDDAADPIDADAADLPYGGGWGA